MKRILFIRHGQTISNNKGLAQGFLSPLNLEGLEQASAATSRFKNCGAEVIYSSNMIRARETAEVLSVSLDLPVIQTGYLRERLRPSEQRNTLHDSDAFKKIENNILDNFLTDNYRYSDEENFEDLKERAKQLFALMLESTYSTALAVTHKNFLYYLTAYGLFGDILTRKEAYIFITKLHIDNTGIVEFVNPTDSEDGWVLHRWNDHSHIQ